MTSGLIYVIIASCPSGWRLSLRLSDIDLLSAAEEGDLDAAYRLAQDYYYGDGGVFPLLLALRRLDKFAAGIRINSVFKFRLAQDYYYGDGGAPEDDEKAFYWFKKAAEGDHISAQPMSTWARG